MVLEQCSAAAVLYYAWKGALDKKDLTFCLIAHNHILGANYLGCLCRNK